MTIWGVTIDQRAGYIDYCKGRVATLADLARPKRGRGKTDVWKRDNVFGGEYGTCVEHVR